MSGATILAVLGKGPEITVSSTIASGFGSNPVVVTNTVTVSSVPTASAWEWVRLSGSAMTARFASSATTDWAVGLIPGEGKEAIYQCNVTINGSVYPSPTVTVSAERAE